MQQTEKLSLNLIEGSDPVDWEVLNDNFKSLEQETARLDGGLAGVQLQLGQGGHNARIAFGTYTGTGTFGASAPTGIAPGFYPVAAFVGDADSAGNYGWPTTMLRGCPQAQGAGVHSYVLPVVWAEDKVSWYQQDYADYQMNVKGKTYYYVIIGYDK